MLSSQGRNFYPETKKSNEKKSIVSARLKSIGRYRKGRHDKLAATDVSF
jgi:hypothetical protein